MTRFLNNKLLGVRNIWITVVFIYEYMYVLHAFYLLLEAAKNILCYEVAFCENFSTKIGLLYELFCTWGHKPWVGEGLNRGSPWFRDFMSTVREHKPWVGEGLTPFLGTTAGSHWTSWASTNRTRAQTTCVWDRSRTWPERGQVDRPIGSTRDRSLAQVPIVLSSLESWAIMNRSGQADRLYKRSISNGSSIHTHLFAIMGEYESDSRADNLHARSISYLAGVGTSGQASILNNEILYEGGL